MKTRQLKALHVEEVIGSDMGDNATSNAQVLGLEMMLTFLMEEKEKMESLQVHINNKEATGNTQLHCLCPTVSTLHCPKLLVYKFCQSLVLLLDEEPPL